jgi:bacterioferritin-associated ferredoxin
MYVCMCHGHRDAEIREQARKGRRTALEAYRALGDEPDCGTCLDAMQEIIDDELARNSAKAA